MTEKKREGKAERILELKGRNNRRDIELSLENRECMTRIICLLREKNVEEERLEDIRQDLTDMLSEAQKRGEDAKSVLGEDLQAFCDEILEELGERPEETQTKRRLAAFVSWLPFLGCFCSGCLVFFWILRKTAWSLEDFLTSLIYLVFYSAAAILVKVFTRKSLDIKIEYWIKGKRKYLAAFCVGFFFVMEVLYFFAG